ncbi:MAG: crossover junction endodeoxyribonuclease RuvC [Patescibacteria group bacterium]|nr:crossover junction endodeoxyribonuclease RuvC [Patescibacteria group bacterium]MDD5490897.1 crossover junction endodeoxyribonuclease RuvC [Patescibacteria group bacterium]
MVILGIDPGFAITGFGLLKKQGVDLTHLSHGCIRTDKGENFCLRLKKLNQELNKLIKKHRPDCLAIEELFFCKNAKTALNVGQARGAIILAAINNNLPIYEYTPLEVKQALTGYGRADKNQVQQMVKIILKLKDIPRPDDAADALAVAFCCASSMGRKS